MTKFRPISFYNVGYKVISKILSNRLKRSLTKWLVLNRMELWLEKTSFDNIIAIQEIVYSLEYDAKALLRMLLKGRNREYV